MSAGLATKLYTQIRLGRASPGLPIGVCWVTFVEAHPATTTRASRHSTIRLKDFITNLLKAVGGAEFRWAYLIQPGPCSVNALVDYRVLSFLFLLHLCGRRRHRDRHLVDRAGEFVVAFFVVFAHRRAEVLADVLGFIP